MTFELFNFSGLGKNCTIVSMMYTLRSSSHELPVTRTCQRIGAEICVSFGICYQNNDSILNPTVRFFRIIVDRRFHRTYISAKTNGQFF